VLSHPLGLPLLLAMNECKVPDELKAHIPCFQHEKDSAAFDSVFGSCFRSWTEESYGDSKADDQKMPGEPALSSAVVKEINNIANNQQQPIFARGELRVREKPYPDGKIDIIISPDQDKNTSKESTPLMVMEVGLNGNDWFQKLDQGMKYLQRMCMSQDLKLVRFEEPLLLAVITADDKKSPAEFQMGVFLCTRKDSSKPDDNFRMALLRQLKTDDQNIASQFFGRMLWLSKEFNQWRHNSHKLKVGIEEEQKEGNDQDDSHYEYFSSNCCRVGKFVGGGVLLLFFWTLAVSHYLILCSHCLLGDSDLRQSLPQNESVS